MRSYPLAVAAELIADPGRAAILTALLDRSSRPASELAQIAGLSQQSASAHLSKLLQGGLLTVQQQGRYRYYYLSTPEVATALEALGGIASKKIADVSSKGTVDLRTIRTCYDHLAGSVAVRMTDRLLERGLLGEADSKNFSLTSRGERWLERIGIHADELRLRSRRLAVRCLDWTERRPHVAGALGSALLERFEEHQWVKPVPGSRALRLTTKGHQALGVLGLR